jgi:hypothetical protein
MYLPNHQTRPPSESETPPAMIRQVTREDVLWNRPVFRAPPLEVTLPVSASPFEVHPDKGNQSGS